MPATRRQAIGALTAAAGAATLGAAATMGGGPAQAETLETYAWNARPLLVFHDGARDGPAETQLALLRRHQPAMTDREMPLIVIRAAGVEIDGRRSALRPGPLRQRFGVADQAFQVVLIGKDTGVKLSRTRPTPPSMIFDLIDAMPMRREEVRRDEMRRKGASSPQAGE